MTPLPLNDTVVHEAENSFQETDAALVAAAALEGEAYLAAGDRLATDKEQKLIDLVKHGIGETDVLAALDKDAIALESFDIRAVGHNFVKKALVAAASKTAEMAVKNGKALGHYAGIGMKLKERLRVIEQGLKEHGEAEPASDIFEYGAYKRFFQIGDIPITNFEQYCMALSWQHSATRFVQTRGAQYQEFVASSLLRCVKSMSMENPEELGAHLLSLCEHIETEWSDVWELSDIKPEERYYGKYVETVTPANTVAEFPLRSFVALAPLMDARYLVASYPKRKGATGITEIAEQARSYGAMVVFDKRSRVKTEHLMATPTAAEALKAVQACIADMNNMFLYVDIAKRLGSILSDFKDELKRLEKETAASSDAESVQMAGAYVRLLAQFYETIANPMVVMAWMGVRAAIMTASIAEHILTKDKTVMGFTKMLSSSEGAKLANLSPGLETLAEAVALSDLMQNNA